MILFYFQVVLPIMVLFISEIAAGIYIYMRRDTLEQDVETFLQKTVTTSYGDSSTVSVIVVDWLQQDVGYH